jgi:photosystem II stability/assembly factor-like uncharacterized protein
MKHLMRASRQPHPLPRVVLALVLALAISPNALAAGFEWLHTAPRGGGFNDVLAFDTDEAWIVGDGGAAVFFDGERPTEQFTTVTADLHGVFGLRGDDADDPDDVEITAVGEDGEVVRFSGDPGSRAWRRGSSDVSTDLNAVWSDGAVWYAVGDGGSILSSMDGLNFVGMASPTTEDLLDVHGDAGEIYIVGERGTVLELDNGVFAPADLDGLAVSRDLNAVFVREGEVWAVGEDELILRLDGRWSVFNPAEDDPDEAFDFLDVHGGPGGSDPVLFVGAQGEAFVFRAGDFDDADSRSDSDLLGVFIIDDNEGYAVGRAGALTRYEGGDDFDGLTRGDDQRFTDVLATSDGQVWAVSRETEITRIAVDGEIIEELDADEPLNGVSGATDIYAVGDDGAAFLRQGQIWFELSPPTNEDLNDVWAEEPAGVAHVVGDDGTLLLFDGLGWFTFGAGTSNDVTAVDAVFEDIAYAVTRGGEILFFNGFEWDEVEDLNTPLTAVAVLDLADVVVGSEDGRIFRFDGDEWEEQDTPTDAAILDLFGNPAEVYAVGEQGLFMRFVLQEWRRLAIPTADDVTTLDGFFETGLPADLVAAGPSGVILRHQVNSDVRPSDEQPEDVLDPDVLSAASIDFSEDQIEDRFGQGGDFEASSPVYFFSAEVDEPDELYRFEFDITGVSGVLDNFELRLLDSDGEERNLDLEDDDDDRDGVWRVRNAFGRILPKGVALDDDVLYTVVFVLRDDGGFDQDPRNGRIRSTLLLGVDEESLSGLTISCQMVEGRQAGWPLELGLLGLTLFVFWLRRRTSRRSG